MERKRIDILSGKDFPADPSLKCAFCDEKPDELITGVIPHVGICEKCVKHIQDNMDEKCCDNCNKLDRPAGRCKEKRACYEHKFWEKKWQ